MASRSASPAAVSVTLRLVPLHRGFDGFTLEHGEVLWWDEDFDASGGSGRATDEGQTLEGEDHLVNRGRRDLEVSLQLGLGGWIPMDAAIGVDEGQVLALGGGEAGLAGR